MPETLLTVDEAAARLRMNPDTLRRQLRQGRIRSVRTGKLWRIPESALEAQDARPVVSATKSHLSALSAAPSFENGPSEEELAALFAPPTPAEIARRLAALRSFAASLSRRETPLDLSAEADPYGYDERAAQLMGHPQDDKG